MGRLVAAPRSSGSEGFRDPVTGAFSRALLDVRLAEETKRARRGGSDCSVCLVDVDHFKSVNDAFGHARGDQVLRQVVERIDAQLRGSDAIFRFGGDEFVLLLPEADKRRAADVAVRVLESVAGAPFDGEPALQVALSVGVASLPEDAADVAELLAVADRRSYMAKHRGRGCFVVDDAGVAVGGTGSRLLERDAALTAAHAFLTGLADSSSGTLRVGGQRGAGHSRFLDELGRLALLRAFEVVHLPGSGDLAGLPSAPPDDGRDVRGGAGGGAGRPVLVLADGEATWSAAADVARERARAAAAVGLVLSGPGTAVGPVGDDLPLRQVVELGPWSLAAVRVWLRTRLRGEPRTELAEFVYARSEGLPARAERMLNRLIERGVLHRSASGWTFDAAAAAAPAAARVLPVPVTDLVGRGEEIDRVIGLLGTDRLLTLVGPGGIGKTRLSLAVAAAIEDWFDHGAVFVGLADSLTTHQVESAVARALDVAEVPGQPLWETIAKHLADQNLLLVLDNFERVLPAAVHVGAWLQMAPRTTVLVTSRERLRLTAERVYAVPGLTLPGSEGLPQRREATEDTVARSAALRLFHSRAQRVDYDFTLTAQNLPTIAQLCHRLDGLPLAIELAAAHVDTMSPQQLLSRLGQRLDLTGPVDAPPRHQTLRAAIEWSYDLLSPVQRDIFNAQAVFAGGARLDAVRAVCPIDQLSQHLATLVEKSLLTEHADPDGHVRYLMLDTISAYAAERLAASPEADTLRAAHAAYYADLVEPFFIDAVGPEQLGFLELMEREHHNIGAALTWTLSRGDVGTAARIAIGVSHFWATRYPTEGRRWLDHLLEARHTLPPLLRWKVLHAAGRVALIHGDTEHALPLAEESLECARAAQEPGAVGIALKKLGQAAAIAGDFQRAERLGRDSLTLARLEGNPTDVGFALNDLAVYALELGQLDEARALATESLDVMRSAEDACSALFCLSTLGEIALIQKDTVAAKQRFEESLALIRRVGDTRAEAFVLHHLATAAELEGAVDRAVGLYSTALALRHAGRERRHVIESLEGLAGVSVGADPKFAARLLGAAEALRDRNEIPRRPAEQQQWEALMTLLRERLDDDVRDDAWTSGRRDPLDTVVAEVLAREPH